MVYGMSLTQHLMGVENVHMVCKLALLRGNIGKPGRTSAPCTVPWTFVRPSLALAMPAIVAGSERALSLPVSPCCVSRGDCDRALHGYGLRPAHLLIEFDAAKARQQICDFSMQDMAAIEFGRISTLRRSLRHPSSMAPVSGTALAHFFGRLQPAPIRPVKTWSPHEWPRWRTPGPSRHGDHAACFSTALSFTPGLPSEVSASSVAFSSARVAFRSSTWNQAWL